MPATLYTVVAVTLATGARHILAEGLTARNAEAVIAMAVLRRGVETEWYTTEPAMGEEEE